LLRGQRRHECRTGGDETRDRAPDVHYKSFLRLNWQGSAVISSGAVRTMLDTAGSVEAALRACD
jgi:hypothetical protein